MPPRLVLLIRYGNVFLSNVNVNMEDLVAVAQLPESEQMMNRDRVSRRYGMLPLDIKQILSYLATTVAREQEISDDDLYSLVDRIIENNINDDLRKRLFIKKLMQVRMNDTSFAWST